MTVHLNSVRRAREDVSRDDTLHLDIPEWVIYGSCGQADPEIFFPERGWNGREAKKVCAGCFVKDECLAWALEIKPDFGVWGGKSTPERQRMLRERRGAA
jgi:WhiB family redox-sensing transcriptional regulator